ncbi:hypothetical protein AGMMS50256_03610 [Betaproteobacteria bacterium]|nr:hypothetical protein AGMMS50256_03610 [Betaproteobacteria bacterium]
MNISTNSSAPINPLRIRNAKGETPASAWQGLALALISGLLFSLDAFLIKHASAFTFLRTGRFCRSSL